MKNKRLITLASSVLLVFVLVLTTILLACAPSAPTTQAPTTVKPQTPSPTKQAPSTVSPQQPTTQPPTAPAAEVYEWKFTTTEPKGTDRWHLYEVWAENVQKDSLGRIQLSLFPTGTLVKGPDILDGLAADVIQIADTYCGYYTEFIPEAAIECGFPLHLENTCRNRPYLV